MDNRFYISTSLYDCNSASHYTSAMPRLYLRQHGDVTLQTN